MDRKINLLIVLLKIGEEIQKYLPSFPVWSLIIITMWQWCSECEITVDTKPKIPFYMGKVNAVTC